MHWLLSSLHLKTSMIFTSRTEKSKQGSISSSGPMEHGLAFVRCSLLPLRSFQASPFSSSKLKTLAAADTTPSTSSWVEVAHSLSETKRLLLVSDSVPTRYTYMLGSGWTRSRRTGLIRSLTRRILKAQRTRHSPSSMVGVRLCLTSFVWPTIRCSSARCTCSLSILPGNLVPA
ncbi:hypothetical protein RSOL_345400 [Rhizoctonia solani AG-3 Rhs1AP]|uniref:Uncharacterized protein n=1 Tax=Rhizoctonia solani AG-3 Rhs1AP TaxID=1086054 RepID=X8J9Q3_9AGAM|nr:hypothetical protein RSOL_345400 [Rhizoctonia solani AG-3 Rhs1AP]